MVTLHLLRNLLATNERRPEENESIGRAWDIRGITFLAVARAVGSLKRYLGFWELGELGRKCGRCGSWDWVLPDCFERDGGIRTQGSDRCHVGEEGKRHRWIRVVDERRHAI